MGSSITEETALIETLVEEPAEWGISSVVSVKDIAGYTTKDVGMDKGKSKGQSGKRKGWVRIL